VKIIKGTDPIDVPHPVFMLFGQPGICKTSLAYSMRDALLLDFDQGAHRASNRKDTLQISTWTDVEELLANREALAPYQSLVIDTVGRCLDVLTADIAVKEPKKAPGGNLSQQGWGTLKTRYKQFLATVKGLGKDILLVSHDKEDKDGDLRVVRPDIVGGSYGEVMKNADFVGYLSMNGKDRILDFNPTDRWIGKNPAQWPPFRVPDVGKATEFFADLYAKGRDALGHISEASADVLKQVEAWRTRISAFTSAADYNAAIPEANTLSALLQPQVKKMLLDCATSAGITFDRGKVCFVDPVKAPDLVELGAGNGAGARSMF
jgi:hypothetical protein